MAQLSDVRVALRWGAWVFAGVTLLVFYRAAALDVAPQFGHPGAQRLAYAVSVAVWLLAVVPLIPPSAFRAVIPVDGLFVGPRPHVRERLRWTLITVTLAATALATFTLPPGQQPTSTSWAAAANGWLLLTIASGRPLTLVLPLLAAPLAAALAAAVPGGAAEVVLMTSRTIGILGLQIPVAMASGALERTSRTAADLRRQRETIDTAAVVAGTLHDDRLRRSRAVATVVEPVLTDLAADPAAAGDDGLRLRCAVAAAQVRRLLAEWYRGGPDPLGADLAESLDRAQAAGVTVDVAVPGEAPLPDALSRAAAEVVLALDLTPGSRLRVTVLIAGGIAHVGILTNAVALPGADLAAPVALRSTVSGATCLLELTCPM